jgi:hypothetical protein
MVDTGLKSKHSCVFLAFQFGAGETGLLLDQWQESKDYPKLEHWDRMKTMTDRRRGARPGGPLL